MKRLSTTTLRNATSSSSTPRRPSQGPRSFFLLPARSLLNRTTTTTRVRGARSTTAAAATAASFSTSTQRCLRTTELRDEDWRHLRADPDRLWRDIHDTARYGMGKRWGGQPEQTGLSRLTLTPADVLARDWFKSATSRSNCRIFTDAIGNLFAVRPGLDNTLPAIFAGSHLDSQPTGGRFDGVLGVCAGVEMLRLLEENWIETVGPVGVVNWTNEEGARFPCSMMGSGVWSGEVSMEKAMGLKEVAGVVGSGRGRTVREELEGIGIVKDGKEGKDHAGGGRDAVVVDASWETGVKMGAHFELHIEQGPHLVDAGEKVGVVEGVQAYRWYEVDFQGRDCHAGTTSFAHRADALLAAARAIVDVRALAEEVGKGALASVGIIEAKPGSVNTVPGYVRMSLDLRCPNEQTLDGLEAKVMRSLKATTAAAAAAADRPTHAGNTSVRAEIKETFRSSAVRFQTGAVDCIEAAARSVLRCAGAAAEQGKTLVRRMTSGAGHDSVFASKRCPTAMIFVPCKGGVSHHPEEWCEKGDCATGASVLTEAVLRFDRTREHGAEI